jgi:hypothetical protein
MELGVGAASKFMLAFMLVYDTMSTTNSSPQTTEINADTRAESLMKWVKLGLIQADAILIIAILIDDEKWPILAGGTIATILMWTQYVHAKNAGLESSEPGTETVYS